MARIGKGGGAPMNNRNAVGPHGGRSVKNGAALIHGTKRDAVLQGVGFSTGFGIGIAAYGMAKGVDPGTALTAGAALTAVTMPVNIGVNLGMQALERKRAAAMKKRK
jgi:hypothetical protein